MTNVPVPFAKESETCKPRTSSDHPPVSSSGIPRSIFARRGIASLIPPSGPWAVELERMAPHLWIMSTRSSTNISPLPKQKVKGRRTRDYLTILLSSHSIWIRFTNLYAKLLLGKFQYEHIYEQYSTLFARFYGPLLFIFGVLSS